MPDTKETQQGKIDEVIRGEYAWYGGEGDVRGSFIKYGRIKHYKWRKRVKRKILEWIIPVALGFVGADYLWNTFVEKPQQTASQAVEEQARPGDVTEQKDFYDASETT